MQTIPRHTKAPLSTRESAGPALSEAEGVMASAPRRGTACCALGVLTAAGAGPIALAISSLHRAKGRSNLSCPQRTPISSQARHPVILSAAKDLGLPCSGLQAEVGYEPASPTETGECRDGEAPFAEVPTRAGGWDKLRLRQDSPWP